MANEDKVALMNVVSPTVGSIHVSVWMTDPVNLDVTAMRLCLIATTTGEEDGRYL